MLTVSSETSLNLNFFSHFVALLNISSFVEFLERNIFLFFISYFWPLIYESFSSFGQRIFFMAALELPDYLLLFSFSRMSTFTSTEGKSTKKGRRLGERYFMISIFQWIKYYIPWLVVFFCVEKKLDINQNLPRIS